MSQLEKKKGRTVNSSGEISANRNHEQEAATRELPRITSLQPRRHHLEHALDSSGYDTSLFTHNRCHATMTITAELGTSEYLRVTEFCTKACSDSDCASHAHPRSDGVLPLCNCQLSLLLCAGENSCVYQHYFLKQCC